MHPPLPPPVSPRERDGGLSFRPNFFKKVGLPGSQFLVGGCWEIKGDFFQGVLQFLHKNNIKSEIFNNKKKLLTKMFFSVITKILIWEILTTNLVTF